MCKFNIDDKVLIDSNSYLLNLYDGITLNKIYIIKNIIIFGGMTYVNIINDDNISFSYLSELFILLEQHRKLKILILLDCISVGTTSIIKERIKECIQN